MGFRDAQAKQAKEKKSKKDAKKKTFSIAGLLREDDDAIINGEAVVELSTDQVASNPQVRTEFNDEYIKDLSRSMKQRQQKLPILVSPANEKGIHIIQDGECRWRAAKLAGIPIKVIIREAFNTEKDRILDQLVANIQRDDLKPLEIAKSIFDLKEIGLSTDDIALELGKSSSYVYRYGKLIDLPNCVKELCEKRVVVDIITLNNLRKLHELNEARAKVICHSGLADGITREKSEAYLKEEKSVNKIAPKAEPEIKVAQDQPVETLVEISNIAVEASSRIDESVSDLALDDSLDLDEINADQEITHKPEPTSTLPEETPEEASNFREVGVETVGIKVLITESNEQCVLCIDRIDDDSNYIWVESQSGKVRIHKDGVKILGIYEK